MDIREQIAEVIYSHEACYTGKNPSCDCGRWMGAVAGRESHADHLADMLVQELGLTEFTVDYPVPERWWATAIQPIYPT
jgi:hypothetical protein